MRNTGGKCSMFSIFEIIGQDLQHRCLLGTGNSRVCTSIEARPGSQLLPEQHRQVRSRCSNHWIHTVHGVDTKLLLIMSTMLPVRTSLTAFYISRAGSYKDLTCLPSRFYVACFGVSKRPNTDRTPQIQQLLRKFTDTLTSVPGSYRIDMGVFLSAREA